MDGKNNPGKFKATAHCLMVRVRVAVHFCSLSGHFNLSKAITAVPYNCLNAIILVSIWIRVVYEHEIREMQSCHPVVVIYLESY